MYRVTFTPEGKVATVAHGTTVSDAAMAAGIMLNASCGGTGLCGKCRIALVKGRLEGGKSTRVKDAEEEVRLACTSRIIEDVTVQLLATAALAERKVLRDNLAQEENYDYSAYQCDRSLCRKIYLELEEPTAAKNSADGTRLLDALNLQGAENISIDFPVLQVLPDFLRQTAFRSTLTVVDYQGQQRVVKLQKGQQKNYAVAIDIGTTTVHAELLCLDSYEVLGHQAVVNSQVSFGEDIITRIVFSEKGEGLAKIQRAIFSDVNELVAHLVTARGLGLGDLSLLSIAANTTMTQLFLGVSARYLRRSPYVPAVRELPLCNAQEIGLNEHRHLQCLFSPGVGSFVGGDISSGILASNITDHEQISLYIDIGTNAEVVIGNSEWLVCSAASAGPAFEGGGLEYGMRYAKGAIIDFCMDPDTFEIAISTAESAPAQGICGTGMLAIVSELFDKEIINGLGKFSKQSGCNRLRQTSGGVEFVVVPAKYNNLETDITVSEIDIDNFIRAKGAIFAACATMLGELGLSFDAIDQILLAGALGSHIDLEHAMRVGLLPEMDKAKVKYIGNSSIIGARLAAFSQKAELKRKGIAAKMTNFELAEVMSYMDYYTASLFLPHTDMSHFPRGKKRIVARNQERTLKAV